ncbi:cupredoxin family protein [Cupriavidus sp. BIC8F]|uniref:cupredoxin domain-containing protein n=1 Tax=Cupriavidus sp. BIC8F TaxID=3079014 RepID=UPI002916D6DD|nr:cupredoxin family protein [Cupriavidus sp. BIC8F]
MKTIKSLLLVMGLSPMLIWAAGSMDGHVSPASATNAAAGQPGKPGKVSRTINVTMNDTMRFEPDSIQVKRGETVRFVVRNVGKVDHEMVIGTAAELKEHAQMMRSMPDAKHRAPNQITLAPGKLGTLVWQFDGPGTVDFGCLVPGHFEAGMVGKVAVK